MILGPGKLLPLVKEQKLVEGLCERELTRPEGAGFDLQLGAVYKIIGEEGYLGIENRKTPETQCLAEYNPDFKGCSFTFPCGGYYIVQTWEKVNTPEDMTIMFCPRTTLINLGLHLITANVSPGYKGKLRFGLHNIGSIDVAVELGARFVFAYFLPVDGVLNQYSGQWQGGRVSTQGVNENQI